MKEIEDKAKRLARQILDIYNEHSFPVDIERITEELGFKFEYADLICDLVVRPGVIRVIQVRSDLTLPRKRRTLAWGLGYALMYNTSQAYMKAVVSLVAGENEAEHFCSIFARYLLLPEEFVFTEGMRCDGDIDKLTSIFLVDEAAMRMRMSEVFPL